VATPSLQHEVMIEAVENHNPEVIVIDEIGRELEAAAARTIAERGVQLIGTAHGRTLENLLLNPTLSDLIGGIESVTLSDEEARRRGTQKTVLERRSSPTFDVLIEIQERDRLSVHPDVAAAVDTLVRGVAPQPEIRYRDSEGQIHIEKPPALPAARALSSQQGFRRMAGDQRTYTGTTAAPRRSRAAEAEPEGESEGEGEMYPAAEGKNLQPIRIYPYGVARNRLMQAIKRMSVPAYVVRNLGDADVLFTLRSHYRDRQQTIIEAEQHGMPIYVLRTNTVSQIEQSLGDLYNLDVNSSPASSWNDVSDQTLSAIEAVMNGQRWADLPPASAAVRRLQHEMAREAQLVSHSYGKEPNRRVRIFRE